ncbi:hypothetical protein AB0L40_24255 [Patulibacter sp. NPDC049589]|uniref:hypothetical protein n=1 Tax=Patulibacter sp. NPDC049589 TaxID=3154731 RepID=UPI003443BA63
MLLTVVGIVVLATIGFWIAGGLVLRVGGVALVVAGVVLLLAYGDLTGLAATLAGLGLWVIGQWHYGLRHHEFASPLARRLFLQLLPARLDPTRGWAVPVTFAGSRNRQHRSR